LSAGVVVRWDQVFRNLFMPPSVTESMRCGGVNPPLFRILTSRAWRQINPAPPSMGSLGAYTVARNAGELGREAEPACCILEMQWLT
jgi:hypothetical protein